MGIDGEAVNVPTPVHCTTHPRALRVLPQDPARRSTTRPRSPGNTSGKTAFAQTPAGRPVDLAGPHRPGVGDGSHAPRRITPERLRLGNCPVLYRVIDAPPGDQCSDHSRRLSAAVAVRACDAAAGMATSVKWSFPLITAAHPADSPCGRDGAPRRDRVLSVDRRHGRCATAADPFAGLDDQRQQRREPDAGQPLQAGERGREQPCLQTG